MSFRSRSTLLVLIVQCENESRYDHTRSGRRSGWRFGRHSPDEVPIVRGGIEDVRSNLIDVSGMGPPCLGDHQPYVWEPELGHGEDNRVKHLVEEVGVG
uniref:Uncharacterized protein n=1 Tax=Nelumbo nucifera TaxID=4432 RepID=A0A822Y3C1_NELNU|nr:TPA_asm: hypothetical protein HUJ06_025591 [Nelumbo nucifera]